MCTCKYCPVKELCQEVRFGKKKHLFKQACELISEQVKDFCIKVVELIREGKKKKLQKTEIEIFLISKLVSPEKEFALIDKGLEATLKTVIPTCKNFPGIADYVNWVEKNLPRPDEIN